MSPLDALGRPQSVLLLGANSGIGSAIVDRFVTGGATRLILAGRHPASGAYPQAESVESLMFDATNTAKHAAFFDDVFDREGPIDVVVAAFGVLGDQTETERQPEKAVEMAEVNYVGAVSSLLHVAARMRRQGSGRIVVLSSVAGVTPRRSNFSYGSTKAALDFFARGLAQSLSDTAVEVLVVRPGFVRTEMTAHLDPVMFAVDPEDVADAVVAGLADHRQVVWVPSILKWVMVAVRLLPPALVRRLGG